MKIDIGSVALLLTVLLMPVLSGCVSRDISDLQAKVAEVLASPPGRIDPLPEIQFYEAYAYRSKEQGEKSPFESYLIQRLEALAASQESEDQGLTSEQEQEIFQRNKEDLEQHDLAAVDMVGLLEDESDMWAIVADPDGAIHRVTIGNYIGKNFGKITDIREDSIVLREIFRDSSGRWQEREAKLVLPE